MKRQITLFSVIAVALALLAGGCAAVLSLNAPSLFWLPLALLGVVVIGLVILLAVIKHIYTGWLRRLAYSIDPKMQSSLQRFPLPALLLNVNGEIQFANDPFNAQVMDGVSPIFGSSVQRLFNDLSESILAEKSVVDVEREERKYTA